MRALVILVSGFGVTLSGAAVAQTATNTPEAIICSMTGSCDATASDSGRMAVGNEKAFSLARPSTTARAAAPSRLVEAAPRHGPVHASARPARRSTPPVRVVPGGGIDMLVTFRLGSAQMTPQAQAEARAFAKAMAAPQMAGLRFAIEGHTDATGDRTRNMALSQARAQSVMDYLVTHGVDAARLTARGYGPDRPIPGTRLTAPANRRVEFVKQV
jgi:OOP family OmpA-OmpF porin